MAEKTVPATTTKEGKNVVKREETRSQEYHVAPPVDIYETENALKVVADVPGVSKEDLDVRVENGILTIQGKPMHTTLGEPLYTEFELVNYYRQFELSDKVDQENITADLKNGVLYLTLPKAEKAKPRKIEIKVQE